MLCIFLYSKGIFIGHFLAISFNLPDRFFQFFLGYAVIIASVTNIICRIQISYETKYFVTTTGVTQSCTPSYVVFVFLCVNAIVVHNGIPGVNPKRCGLFCQLRMRGGSKSAQWEMAVSGCFNFHPNSTNSTSYESWHLQLKFETSLRSLRLILWPQEVSEVTEVKMKKNLRRKS